MMLNILENTNLGELECTGVDHIHVVTEALKLALAERDQFVCDAAFKDMYARHGHELMGVSPL